MKKLLKFSLFVMISLLLAAPVSADQNVIKSWTIFDAETIAKSESSTNVLPDSFGLNLATFKPEGYFSIDVVLTGAGTAKFEFQVTSTLSNGVPTNFQVPSGASDIVTAHTVGSGPAADGKATYSFSPPICKYMRIKCTETGGANPVVITVTLTVQ